MAFVGDTARGGEADGRLLREQLAAVEAATVDGIFTVDERGVFLTASERAAELFGMSPEELVGAAAVDFMTDEMAAVERAHLREHGITSVSRVDRRTVRVDGVRPDGTTFPFELAVRELRSDGRPQYVCVVHDLSEIRRSRARILELTEELREQNTHLEEVVEERTAQLKRSIEDLATANQRLGREVAEREAIARSLQSREVQLERLLHKERELGELRSRFVSMASHEFRTPLTTMLSSVEVIEMSLPDPPEMVGKHTRRIREAIGYLRNVLEDFLQLGKLDVKGTDLHVQEVDLPTFLAGLADELQQMSKPGQDLELRIRGEVGATSHSANALRIVVTNLVGNAIKYSDEGSAIDLEVERVRADATDATDVTDVTDANDANDATGGAAVSDELVLRIVDEGIGIPEAEQHFLFERFYRASNAETIKGTGLGLHIAMRYVKALRGTIAVESEAGQGTTFTVRVPYELPALGY